MRPILNADGTNHANDQVGICQCTRVAAGELHLKLASSPLATALRRPA